MSNPFKSSGQVIKIIKPMASPTSSLTSDQSSQETSSVSSESSTSILNSEGEGEPSSPVTSQMGFLEELKKLAEKRRSDSDGLLMDTLKKTVQEIRENGVDTHEKQRQCLPLKLIPNRGPDNEKRKQHG